MLANLQSTAAALAILAAALGLGRAVWGMGRLPRRDPLGDALGSLLLGMVLAAAILAALGLCGLLRPPLLAVLTTAGCFAAIGHFVAERLSARRLGPKGDGDEARSLEAPGEGAASEPLEPKVAGWMLCLAAVAGVMAAGAALPRALAPPLSSDGIPSALVAAKEALRDGRPPPPDDAPRQASFAAPLWFAWAMALDGPVAAQMLDASFGVALALAAAALARTVLGRRGAWLTAAVVLIAPGVVAAMGRLTPELPAAVPATLAVAAWWRWAVNREGAPSLALAGLLLLVAGAVAPMVAVVTAAGLSGATGWIAAQRFDPRRRAVLVGFAGAVALAVCAAIRWSSPEGPPGAEGIVSPAPFFAGAAMFAVPGMFCAAALPGLLIARRLRGLAPLLAPGVGYLAVWWAWRGAPGLLPLVPILSAAAVWSVVELRRLPAGPARLSAAALGAIVAASAVAPWLSAGDRLGVALGREPRDDYLRRREPSYMAAEVANLMLAPDSCILSTEPATFYFERRVVDEPGFRRRTGYDRPAADAGTLRLRLGSAGVTHLLLAEPLAPGATRPTLGHLVDAQPDCDGAERLLVLTEYVYRPTDGPPRRYRLIRLR
jgi:hypothetical protein